ncbi:Uncharacterised protein [Rothia kristinae]|nr:Uncharacterised protein [Rothia kristinae]
MRGDAWNHVNGSALTVAPEIREVAQLAGGPWPCPPGGPCTTSCCSGCCASRAATGIRRAPDSGDRLVVMSLRICSSPASATISGFAVADPSTRPQPPRRGRTLRFLGDVWRQHACCVTVLRGDLVDGDPGRTEAFLRGLVRAQAWAGSTARRPPAAGGRAAAPARAGHPARPDRSCRRRGRGATTGVGRSADRLRPYPYPGSPPDCWRRCGRPWWTPRGLPGRPGRSPRARGLVVTGPVRAAMESWAGRAPSDWTDTSGRSSWMDERRSARGSGPGGWGAAGAVALWWLFTRAAGAEDPLLAAFRPEKIPAPWGADLPGRSASGHRVSCCGWASVWAWRWSSVCPWGCGSAPPHRGAGRTPGGAVPADGVSAVLGAGGGGPARRRPCPGGLPGGRAAGVAGGAGDLRGVRAVDPGHLRVAESLGPPAGSGCGTWCCPASAACAHRSAHRPGHRLGDPGPRGDAGSLLRPGIRDPQCRDRLAYDEMLAVILVIGLLGHPCWMPPGQDAGWRARRVESSRSPVPLAPGGELCQHRPSPAPR